MNKEEKKEELKCLREEIKILVDKDWIHLRAILISIIELLEDKQ